MRTNYKRGSEKERRIVNKARKEGKIAFRSAGSHSPIDVCIIDRIARKISFVQSKLGYFPEVQKKRILEEFKDLQGTFEVEFRFE